MAQPLAIRIDNYRVRFAAATASRSSRSHPRGVERGCGCLRCAPYAAHARWDVLDLPPLTTPAPGLGHRPVCTRARLSAAQSPKQASVTGLQGHAAVRAARCSRRSAAPTLMALDSDRSGH